MLYLGTKIKYFLFSIQIISPSILEFFNLFNNNVCNILKLTFIMQFEVSTKKLVQAYNRYIITAFNRNVLKVKKVYDKY